MRPTPSSSPCGVRLFYREAEGLDLLTFLSDQGALSRRAAKRLLDERGVFVNGRRVWMAHHRLRAGDEVEIQRASPAEERRALPLLAETPEALVVNKPAGRLTNEDPSSVEAELQRIRNEPEIRAVHRLDRDTTGCLWFSRSASAHDAAVRAFKTMSVRKVYEAIVLGRYPRPRDLLEEPIEGREARTRVERLSYTARVSRLRLTLETGRTHQIRQHLLGAGYPIAGDKTYGAARSLEADFRALPRQMLHAIELEAHPAGGEPIHVRAPLPEDYLAALKTLGLLPCPGRSTTGTARPLPARPQRRADRQKPRSSSSR